MRFSVFHPGTQHSWQTATALQQLGRLEWYATSIFYNPDRFPYNLEKVVPARLAQRLHAEFRRFSHPGLDPALVRTVGLAEWVERIASRAGFPRIARQLDAYGNTQFAQLLQRDIARMNGGGLWGYSGSSQTTFAYAKTRDMPCVLDRTIGDGRIYNQAMEAVKDRYPEWFLPTEDAVTQDSIERAQAEYDLADVILTGGDFAAGTVRETAGPANAAKVRVLPYCYDENLFGSIPAPRPVTRDEPVKFLFVGLINPRKGIHHLLEAIARIDPAKATLTIVGAMRVPETVFSRYADRVTYIPTLPRSDIPALMAQHHALVFPSYFEGSALSLLEALASGLAIIQTQSSGNGATHDTGIMLDAPDTQSLYEAMMQLIDDRDLLNHFRAHAQAEAQNYTFTRYRDNIAALLDDMAV